MKNSREWSRMKASDLTKQTVVRHQGQPHLIEHIQVQAPSARGSATLYKVRIRNAQTQQKVDLTLKGDDQIETADLEKQEVQFLYENQGRYAFMSLEDYSQFELNREEIDSSVPYLVDEMEGITALISDERVIGIQLPDVVEMEIVECDPSMKGASATARTKPAVLTTGLTVQVPEYLAQGERIRVDTRTDAFISRA